VFKNLHCLTDFYANKYAQKLTKSCDKKIQKIPHMSQSFIQTSNFRKTSSTPILKKKYNFSVFINFITLLSTGLSDFVFCHYIFDSGLDSWCCKLLLSHIIIMIIIIMFVHVMANGIKLA